jgi:hypothetical protein
MFRQSSGWTYTTGVQYVLLCSGLLLALGEVAVAGDVQCRFKAETETTEVHVLSDGKPLWAGSIEKLQTRAVSVPEGPFTVISKIYNQNLKMKEDVRTEMHTRQCLENATLIVPLFPDPKER